MTFWVPRLMKLWGPLDDNFINVLKIAPESALKFMAYEQVSMRGMLIQSLI
jgi:hypothetical protein